MSLELTTTEKNLADRLRILLKLLEQDRSDASKKAVYLQNQKEMVEKAHDLHKVLAARGQEPKHTRHMIDNRGTQPSEPEFYDHVHAVEDLLAFIDDPDNAGDPPDVTINAEFKFKVFSRRWGHDDTYAIRRTADGWHVQHVSIGGDCDKSGKPYLFDNFHQDSIQYPRGIGDYVEHLWNEARDQGLDSATVQAELDRLAQWVSSVEKAAPSDGSFAAM